MSNAEKDDQYGPEETVRRRDEAIRRALNTPPKPQKDMVGKSGRPPRKRAATKSRSVEKK
jgi:hypothetical protein